MTVYVNSEAPQEAAASVEPSVPRPLRFAALGDSLTAGVGDRVDGGWRGWAVLLAEALTPAGGGGGDGGGPDQQPPHPPHAQPTQKHP
ncbi:hypothetical protein ACFC0H_27055, partial [Streptomyces niveus]